jgi:hypothetical protein
MTTFMPPPPAATFLAFHPQDNNIIAIGMEDSTIQIYNVRVDEVNTITFLLSSSWCKGFGYVDHTRAVEGFLSLLLSAGVH